MKYAIDKKIYRIIAVLSIVLACGHNNLWGAGKPPVYKVLGNKFMSVLIPKPYIQGGVMKLRVDYDIPKKYGIQSITIAVKEKGDDVLIEEQNFSASGFGSQELEFVALGGFGKVMIQGYLGSSFEKRIAYLNPRELDLKKPDFAFTQNANLYSADYYEIEVPDKLKRASTNRVLLSYDLSGVGGDAKHVLTLKGMPEDNIADRVIVNLKGSGKMLLHFDVPDKPGQSYVLNSYIGKDFKNRIDKIENIELQF